ncbi:hypothetical protein DCS_00328 [Drechmeria coniospora]|uniref:Uncharacterized protein n=1 Tax=Drechmeria coniospora TaxID=98403 RepID=A0A151GQ59_DRECN|nr:hypothetical protein DCS_00328 [Drechmeria coniospora]KYK59198.1 hypothetical protein DCS_00328 [Drechmeria coniospora]
MICPRACALLSATKATTIAKPTAPARRRRCISTTARDGTSDDAPSSRQTARARGSRETAADCEEARPLLDSLSEPNASLKAAFAPTSLRSPDAATARKRDSRVMLILHGLSPNLNASDFYRLAPNDLSDWRSVIKQGMPPLPTVQQQRNPSTLEPLGRYHVSFSTAQAAISYRDRLVRLHRLARHKLSAPNDLWESSIPAHLKSSAGADPAAELEAFTLVPASQPTVDVDRKRVSTRNAWAKGLADRVGGLGYGDKPPVVLLDVYPPTLSADDLSRFIREDGIERDCEWELSPPQHLASPGIHGRPEEGCGAGSGFGSVTKDVPSSSEYRDFDTMEKRRSRFVVACATEEEARRFHRHWNERELIIEGGDEDRRGVAKCIVHASIINW